MANRKKGYKVNQDSSLGYDQTAAAYNPTIQNKHNSIDEYKAKINNNIWNHGQKETLQSVTARNIMHSQMGINQGMLYSADHTIMRDEQAIPNSANNK